MLIYIECRVYHRIREMNKPEQFVAVVCRMPEVLSIVFDMSMESDLHLLLTIVLHQAAPLDFYQIVSVPDALARYQLIAGRTVEVPVVLRFPLDPHRYINSPCHPLPLFLADLKLMLAPGAVRQPLVFSQLVEEVVVFVHDRFL